MPNDQLFDYMQAQHETNQKFAEALGRIEQSLDDTKTRLFGEGGLSERVKTTEKEVESLVQSRAVTKKVVSILVAVFTFINGALLAWFKHSK